MFSALFSFLGGSVFRMVWGEISAYWNKRQDHEHEVERMKLQADLDDKAHQRTLENLRLQADLNVRVVEAQSEADQAGKAADAFTEAMKSAFKPSGIFWVDLWNGCVRPAFATICLVLWATKVYVQGGKMDPFDIELMAAILGFYFADRSLGKRGK